MTEVSAVSPQAIEKSWFAAALEIVGVEADRRETIYRGSNYIREHILDGIADRHNLEGTITSSDIDGKSAEVNELAHKVAVFDEANTIDDKQLKQQLTHAEDELEELRYRKTHGIGRYMDILRIPQPVTTYKTRSFYMPFDHDRAALRFAPLKQGSRAKPVIEVVINDHIRAKIGPRTHALYEKIAPYVGRWIYDVYIERDWSNEKEGELIFVFQPEWY